MRRLLPLLMGALLSLVALAQEGRQVDPEQVKATLDRLADAFSSGEKPARLDAIRAAAKVPHEDVIRAVEKEALKSRDAEVRGSALELFRYSSHPEALLALHRHYKRVRRTLDDQPELAVSLFRAIGQHGSVESIDVLTRDVFRIREHQVVRSRILSLGRVRDPEAVHALFDLMKKAGPQKLSPHMATFRASLVILTGVDHGESADLWNRWYQDHKKKLTVQAKPPQLPRVLQAAWDRHWNEYDRAERRRRREDRGGD